MSLFLIKLSWKNIWRNKRRTLITVNAIALGVAWLIWAHNFFDSFHDQMITNAIQYNSGHLAVSSPGFQDHRESQLFLRDAGEAAKWFKNSDAVKVFTPRVHLQGMLSSPYGSASIWYAGVNPETEAHTTEFASKIVEGTYLAEDNKTKSIVLGMKLAKRLNVKLGSKVVALTQGVDGSIGNELFRVTGIFETHSNADKALAFVKINDARALASLPPRAVHQISVVLTDDSLVDKFQKEFYEIFDAKKVSLLTWKDLDKPLMATVELQKSANGILMFIILFIAALGIANAILMSILERTREFGVMMAIGTSKPEMVKMVLTETILLSGVGLFVGNVIGIAVTLYFGSRGFDLNWLTDQTVTVNGFITTMTYPIVQISNSISITAAVLGLAVLAAFAPIQHIAKLNAIKALNHR